MSLISLLPKVYVPIYMAVKVEALRKTIPHISSQTTCAMAQEALVLTGLNQNKPVIQRHKGNMISSSLPE